MKEGEMLNADDWKRLGDGSLWETARLRAHFPVSFDVDLVKQLVQELVGEGVLMGESVNPVEDKDWVLHVQQSWKPIFIEPDLAIVFPWHLDNVMRVLCSRTRSSTLVCLCRLS
jgi:ribosomal protein L11 methylase PrmA